MFFFHQQNLLPGDGAGMRRDGDTGTSRYGSSRIPAEPEPSEAAHPPALTHHLYLFCSCNCKIDFLATSRSSFTTQRTQTLRQ